MLQIPLKATLGEQITGSFEVYDFVPLVLATQPYGRMATLSL
jgi:hypothetical protein